MKKTFRGIRSQYGLGMIFVEVRDRNGQRVCSYRLKGKNAIPFDWSHTGTTAYCSARAILVDLLGDPSPGTKFHDRLMVAANRLVLERISQLPRGEWRMPEATILSYVAARDRWRYRLRQLSTSVENLFTTKKEDLDEV